MLYRLGIPVQMMKYVSSFLSNREAALSLDGVLSNMEPVLNGVPQGSPLSGILSAFYSQEVLVILAQRATRLRGAYSRRRAVPAQGMFYVDDGDLTTHSPSAEENIRELGEAWTVVREWFKSAGLKEDPGKGELIHYTRKRVKDVDLPPLVITGSDGKE